MIKPSEVHQTKCTHIHIANVKWTLKIMKRSNDDARHDICISLCMLSTDQAMKPILGFGTRVWHHLFISVHPIDIYWSFLVHCIKHAFRFTRNQSISIPFSVILYSAMLFFFSPPNSVGRWMHGCSWFCCCYCTGWLVLAATFTYPHYIHRSNATWFELEGNSFTHAFK